MLVSKKTAQSIEAVSKVSERKIVIILSCNPKVTVVACYAPSEVATSDDKDKSYQSLADTLLALPKHNLVITLGDFNARMERTGTKLPGELLADSHTMQRPTTTGIG